MTFLQTALDPPEGEHDFREFVGEGFKLYLDSGPARTARGAAPRRQGLAPQARRCLLERMRLRRLADRVAVCPSEASLTSPHPRDPSLRRRPRLALRGSSPDVRSNHLLGIVGPLARPMGV